MARASRAVGVEDEMYKLRRGFEGPEWYAPTLESALEQLRDGTGAEPTQEPDGSWEAVGAPVDRGPSLSMAPGLRMVAWEVVDLPANDARGELAAIIDRLRDDPEAAVVLDRLCCAQRRVYLADLAEQLHDELCRQADEDGLQVPEGVEAGLRALYRHTGTTLGDALRLGRPWAERVRPAAAAPAAP